MKFLHAADIHLDSPLTGLASRGIPESLTRHCTRQAFENLIDLAIGQDVAFVIIAGDLYDGDWRDYSTGLFFARQMQRLNRPCYLLRGNHDARSQITKHLQNPPNVHEFSSRKAETFEPDGLNVALHGRSFPDRAVPEDLTLSYPPPIAGKLNIGVLHTSAEDPGEHDTYAPCTIPSLIAKNYHYWALGHIHQRTELHRPGGNPWIIFPGNIQGRHARETGPKGCTIVEAEADRITDIRHHDLDVLRWAAIDIPLDGADTLADAARRLRTAFTEALETCNDRPLIVRVTLSGASILHADLAADPQAIDAECRNAAAAVSANLHIERVRVRTHAPTATAAQDEAASTLRRLFLEALEHPDIQQDLIAEFQRLAGQMPSAPGRDKYQPPTTIDALRGLAPDAWHIVARALAGTRA